MWQIRKQIRRNVPTVNIASKVVILSSVVMSCMKVMVCSILSTTYTFAIIFCVIKTEESRKYLTIYQFTNMIIPSYDNTTLMEYLLVKLTTSIFRYLT